MGKDFKCGLRLTKQEVAIIEHIEKHSGKNASEILRDGLDFVLLNLISSGRVPPLEAKEMVKAQSEYDSSRG